MKIPYKEVDKECHNLIRAINKIPGIATTSCCCGHDKQEFHVGIEIKDFTFLPVLLYYLDICHTDFPDEPGGGWVKGWTCQVYTDCAMSEPRYMILSNRKGELAYKESELIAKNIEQFLKSKIDKGNDMLYDIFAPKKKELINKLRKEP